MESRSAEDSNRPRVRRSDVADVRHEPVARIDRIEPAHHAIANDLRHDRGGCDRGTPRVAVDERTMRRSSRAEPKSVDQTCVRRGMEIGQNRSQRSEVRPVQTRTVDLEGRHHANVDLRGRADDCVEERLTLLRRDLLGVVQPGKRTHPGTAEQLVVEEHAGNDERAGEGTPPSLVSTRDEANAEAPIMCEKPLPARSRHVAEDRR